MPADADCRGGMQSGERRRSRTVADTRGPMTTGHAEKAACGALWPLSVEGLRLLAHPQGVVGEVHSDLVAVALDLPRRIEPRVVRDHVRQVAHGGLDNQFSLAGELRAENFRASGFSRVGKSCSQFFDRPNAVRRPRFRMKPVTPNLRDHRTEAFVAALMFFIAIGSLAASPAQAQSDADRAFLAWAVQIEIQQQDMGRIAERRAQNDEVRNLGVYLVQRHQQAQQRLENVANQLGEVLSNKLSATHLRVQSRFRSIAEASFDGAFIHHEIGDYRSFRILRGLHVLTTLWFGNSLQAKL